MKINMRRALISTGILLGFAIAAAAQSAYTPEKRSPERKAILDALRVPVERELKQKIVFVADNFKVQGTWAFVSGTPQNLSGGEPDYRGTPYREQKDQGAFDNNFFALLRKTGGKWRVVKYAIGCTDVCYLDWWSLHKAPKAIFPHTE
jgi:hypothetical protein